MKKIVLFSFMFLCLASSAQIKFANVYSNTDTSINSNNAIQIIPTSDKKYLIVVQGSTSILKLDSLGNIIWSNSYWDLPNSILEMPDGNYLVHLWGGSPINLSSYFTIIDTSGYPKVVKKIGHDFALGRREVIISGNSIIDGSLSPTLTSLDFSLSKIWSKSFYADSTNNYFGSWIIDHDSKGNIIGLMSYDSTALPCQQYGYVLMKMDSTGNLIWSKEFCFLDNRDFKLDNLLFDRNNTDHIFITGSQSHPGGPYSTFLIELDSNGLMLHSRKYYNKNFKSYVPLLFIPSSGRIVTSVNDNSNVLTSFLKINSNGNIASQKSYIDTIHNIRFNYAVPTDDGGTALTGSFYDKINEQHIVVIKEDSLFSLGCIVDTNLYSDSSLAVSIFALSLIVKTNPLGIFGTAFSGGTDSLIQEPLCLNTGISDLVKRDNELIIYPNPLTSSSTIQLNTKLKDAEVIIYDMLGKKMMRKKMSGDKMEIEKGEMESGIYFVKVSTDEKQFVQKIIVE